MYKQLKEIQRIWNLNLKVNTKINIKSITNNSAELVKLKPSVEGQWLDFLFFNFNIL